MSRHVALMAAAVLGLAGCGSGDDEEIRAAVTGYLEAVADRDGPRACSYLTENAQLGIYEFKLVHVGPDHPDEACAAAVTRRAPRLSSRRLREANVDQIEIDGDHATARADGHEVQLEKADDDWKIDVFGLASDVAEGAAS